MSDEAKKFTYGNSFQKKVIANLIYEERFLSNNYKIIKPEYFENYKYYWLVNNIIEHYKKYLNTPTYDSIIIHLSEDDTLDEKQKENLVSFIAKLYKIESYKTKILKDRDHIQEHVHKFCWEQNLINALRKSTEYAKSGEFEKILPEIELANNEGKEEEQGLDFDDVEHRLNNEVRKNVLPLPWKPLNDRIGGGIGGGEFMAIVGAMGSGKSLIASNLGVCGRRHGYVVVLYTLELSKEYFMHRTDVVLSRTSSDDLLKLKKENKKAYGEFIKQQFEGLPKGGKLIIKEFPSGITANDIKADLKWLRAQGIDPNMFVIDYLDNMNPIGGTRGKKDWEKFEDITLECRDGIARELGISGIGLVQGNTTSIGERSLKAGSTSGGARRLHPADIVLGYGRHAEAKNNNRANLSIIKSRFGKDAITLNVLTDYNVGLIDVLDDEIPFIEEEQVDEKKMKEKLLKNFNEFNSKRGMENPEIVDYD